jgi:Ca-activated chloride channel family protein
MNVQAPAEGAAPDPEFMFASGVVAYGMLLRDSPHKGTATFDMAAELVEDGLAFDPYGYRAELVDLIKRAKNL